MIRLPLSLSHVPRRGSGASKTSLRGIAVITALLVAVGAVGAQTTVPPVIPGLHGKHPLTEALQGKLLIGELRCAACHAGMQTEEMKAAPELREAGSRLTIGFMQQFVANPASVHPGTTMPGLFGAESAEKRAELAEAIADYLTSLKAEAPPESPAGEADPEQGKVLYHEIGCVACHGPRDAAGTGMRHQGMVSLAQLQGKYQPGALAAFLHGPLEIRPSGRMPDMKLTREETYSLAAYLNGGKPVASDPPVADSRRIEAGRQAFQQFHCAACHQVGDKIEPLNPPGPPLAMLDPARGCLSGDPGAAPDFQLDDSQRQAIRSAIRNSDRKLTTSDRIRVQMTRLNCIACHVRDDFGGVASDLDGYFRTREEALGNEARIPPPLTLIGAKLRPEWMNAVLHDGLTVRPYMKTRMPQFGDSGLAGLAGLFEEVDHLEPVELPGPDRNTEPDMRDGALQLLGDQGLNCIACHNYNGKESPGMKGLDLMTSYQRLKPAWFTQFMKKPAASRPGIIMPGYWPDGKALQPDILGGDSDLQLGALWHHFSLGRSARDPSGLRAEPSTLEVTDKTRTYRGRSSVAGYRGIAVGFPGGLNYAFNAQNGSISAIWKGDYVRVDWQGQGSGSFHPLGRPVSLPQDVSFLSGSDAGKPWPLRPETTEEQPVNPDPLYPRNQGYAFVGYSLEEDSEIPTFEYRCGSVRITDRSVGTGENEASVLRRSFRFSAPGEQTVWFRVLTGNIEPITKTEFRTPGLKLTIEPAETLLRATANGEMELLIKLSLPQGDSTFTLSYELLR